MFLKKARRVVVAPVKGTCIPMDQVPDKAFSSKMMGDGFAIIPSGNRIVAPVAGQLCAISKTKHAICIRTKSGLEVLVHVGLDTVKLGGEGFTCQKQVGRWVREGTPVMCFDEAFMKSQGMDMTTIVVFTEGFSDAVQLSVYGQEDEAGEVLIS